MERRFGRETGRRELVLLSRDEIFIAGTAAAADPQLDLWDASAPADLDEGVDHGVEALLRAHAREETDRQLVARPLGGARRQGVVAREADAVRRDLDPVRREAEAPGHPSREVAARRDPAVHVGGPLLQGGPRLGAPRLRQGIQERLLALEEADDLAAERRLQLPGEPREERVREEHHVGSRQLLEPRRQLVEIAGLVAELALEHRHRQFADVVRPRLRRLAGGPLEQRGRIEQLPQPARRAAVERGFLVEEDVDAAEERGRPGGGRRLVQRHRQIQRHHDGVVALPPEGRDECVVAETVPAIHAAGAGGDLDEVHATATVATFQPGTSGARPGCGTPYGSLSGNFVMPANAPNSREKSLFTSPERQSVRSSASAGSWSATVLKLTAGS